MNSKRFALRALAAFTCTRGLNAFAQTPSPNALPKGPITLVVPFAAGGATDIVSRLVAKKVTDKTGVSIVIENIGGGGGVVGAQKVARAPKDGSVLLMGTVSTHAINPIARGYSTYHPLKDFTPLTMVSTSPSVLVAHPRVPANTVRALIDLAKARPGQLNFAIGAMGSSLHLAGDAFKMKAGVYIVNIPYRGTAPAVQDVLAGQVELMFAAVGNVQQHIRAGKLKALGVTSASRLPALPDVPAIAETLPGYESSAWFGLFGPAHMPAELTRRLSEAARAAVQSPEVRRRIEHEGATPVGNSPEAFAKFVESEIHRWGAVVRYAGAKPE